MKNTIVVSFIIVSYATMTTMIQRAANQLVLRGSRSKVVVSNATRAFTAKSPGGNPLELLARESERRHLCDHDGYRTPGSHWTMALAAAGETSCHVS